MGKAHVGVKGSAGQARDSIELARIDHPFIDEDEARSSSGKELAQYLRAGADALTISLGDEREAILAEQLPGQFTPQCIDDTAIRFRARLAWGEFVAYEDGSLSLWRPGNSRFIQNRFDSQQVSCGRA